MEHVVHTKQGLSVNNMERSLLNGSADIAVA